MKVNDAVNTWPFLMHYAIKWYPPERSMFNVRCAKRLRGRPRTRWNDGFWFMHARPFILIFRMWGIKEPRQ